MSIYVRTVSGETAAEVTPLGTDHVDLVLVNGNDITRITGTVAHVERIIDDATHQLSLIKAQRATAHPAHQKATNLAGVAACREAIRARVTDSGEVRVSSVWILPNPKPRTWRKVEVEVDEADFFTLRPSVGDVLTLARPDSADASTPATGPEAA